MPLALEHIRILDLSRLAPGPYCTMILGDLGANIIKIEDTNPAYAPPRDEKTAAYNAHDRNKRGLTLNLRLDSARQVFYKLAERADVVVEGFRPGVAKRLAVDYDTISKINPKIVYCSISGFGQDGPYRLMAGHDPNYISIAGAMGVIGTADGPPVAPLNLLADYAGGGMQGAIGILAALAAREQTGKGQYVDISMMDGVMSLLASETSAYFMTGNPPRRGKTMLTGAVPYFYNYETKDGKYIALGCAEPYFWEAVCRALGREDYVTHQNTEGAKREEIFRTFKDIFHTKTRDEWWEILKQIDSCATPVYDYEEVFDDPQVRQRQMMIEVQHPTLGKVKQVGIGIKLSDTPGAVRSTAPLLGQHTEEVLKEAGYTSQQIAALRQEGAIL